MRLNKVLISLWAINIYGLNIYGDKIKGDLPQSFISPSPPSHPTGHFSTLEPQNSSIVGFYVLRNLDFINYEMLDRVYSFHMT